MSRNARSNGLDFSVDAKPQIRSEPDRRIHIYEIPTTQQLTSVVQILRRFGRGIVRLKGREKPIETVASYAESRLREGNPNSIRLGFEHAPRFAGGIRVPESCLIRSVYPENSGRRAEFYT